MRIKKNVFWAVLIMFVLVIAGFFMISGDEIPDNVEIISDDVQIVKMYVSGANYVFEPSSVVVGKPVRIEADMSKMPGCAKSVISSELGIRKTFSSSSNSVTFTPKKAGTFYIACSMNMYKGNLIVLDSAGNKSDYIQQVQVSSDEYSCGNKAGCGCGG